MEKISKIISNKVLSIEEGCEAGYVLDVVFDEELKTFEGVKVVDEESENIFFLSRKNILSFGQECIIIENSLLLELEIFSQTNNPIGKNVYDKSGTFLGKVQEVEIAGKNVKKLITNKCEIPPKFIQKSGEDFLLFGLTKNSKKNKIKPIFKEKQITEKISEILPNVVTMPMAETAENKEERNTDNSQNQMRLFINPSQLIGRQLTADLFGFNNELIARKNEVINKKILNNAKNHNKLNLLAHFSR